MATRKKYSKDFKIDAVILVEDQVCQRNEVKHVFIAHHKKTWPIDVMCQVLGVSRSGYDHDPKRRKRKASDPEHEAIL